MNIPIVEVPYCSCCQQAVVPDLVTDACPTCGQAMERRVPFCTNPKCRSIVLPDEHGRCQICGHLVELRTYEELRRNHGFTPYPLLPANGNGVPRSASTPHRFTPRRFYGFVRALLRSLPPLRLRR